MYSRKLQKVGYSTTTVSLPSDWVREANLKPGDYVFLSPENDGSLKLFPKILERSEGIEEYIYNSDLCDDSKLMERIIVGSYILGRDLFSVTSSGRVRSEHIEEIRKIMPKLIGLGIVEETSDHVTIQCSLDPKKFHVDMLLRRLSVISLTIMKEAVQALVDFDRSLAEDAISREDEADTLYLLGLRLLISAQKRKEVAKGIGLAKSLDILYFGLMLKYLELIGDYAEEIARSVIELIQKYREKLTSPVIRRVSNLNDLAHDIVLKSVDSFLVGDIKIANSILEMVGVVELERDRLMRELPEIPHLRLILWNITRIADNGAGVALIAINNALERETKLCSKRIAKINVRE